MKLTDFIALVAAGAIGLAGIDYYRSHAGKPMAPSVAPTTARLQALSPRDDTSWIKPREGAAVPAGEGTGEFKCDGRTHCSHMRSCAEAAFFIQHCPNTEMDGDGDGVPCERQWC